MDKDSTKEKRRFKAWEKADPESLADILRTLQECLGLRASNQLSPIPVRSTRRNRKVPPR